jgi:hypothetical protein
MDHPLVVTNIAIERVDLPIEKVIFHSYVNVYRRVREN